MPDSQIKSLKSLDLIEHTPGRNCFISNLGLLKTIRGPDSSRSSKGWQKLKTRALPSAGSGLIRRLLTIRRERPERKSVSKLSQLFLLDKEKLSWVRSRGKQDLLVFTSREIDQLRSIFRTLDFDKKEYLFPEQLFQPFRKIGIAGSYQQFLQISKKYDKNQNGKIQFSQFLLMAKECLAGRDLERVKAYFSSEFQQDRECFGLCYQKQRRDTIMFVLRSVLHEKQAVRSSSDLARLIKDLSHQANSQKERL